MIDGVRVTHVIASDDRRGAEIDAVNLSTDLRGAALRSSVVALSPGGSPSALHVEVLGRNWWSPSTLRALRGHITKSTVVVAHGSTSLPATVVAGSGLGVPLIYKNIGDPWFWATTRRRRWQTAALLLPARFVAALTPTAARAIEECWKVDRSKVVVTGSGRDPSRFRPPTPVERSRSRADLDVRDEERVVLILGALTPEKQPYLALAVAEKLPHVTFLFAGDGPLGPELSERAATMEGRVRVLGLRDDTVRLLHAADVLLLTSASEGLPGVLIEAGMSGLPSVATGVGYVSDIIDDGVTGVISRNGEVTELVRGVVDALRYRDEMGQRARERCEELFDASVVRERWLDLILRASQDPSRA